MPLLSALLLLSAATPGSVKLASSGFEHVNLNDKTADFFDEFFAQQLQEAGVPVTTKKAVASLVGLERQKQLLGCGEEQASCLAELAGALGVDGVILGNIARFGNEYAVTVKLISARDAQTIFSESGRLDGDKALLDWLTRSAKKMAAAARKGAPPVPREVAAESSEVAATSPGTNTTPPRTEAALASPPAAPTVRGGAPVGAWVATGASAALAVGSGATYLVARLRFDDLQGGRGAYATTAQVSDAAAFGNGLQQASALLLAGAVVSAGVATWLFASQPGPSLSVIAGPSGGAVVVQGRWP